MLFKKNNKSIITLDKAKKNTPYIISEIKSDEKTKEFLFTLGCFENEEIALISKLSNNFVVNIRDSRFAIDDNIAKSIVLNKI